MKLIGGIGLLVSIGGAVFGGLWSLVSGNLFGMVLVIGLNLAQGHVYVRLIELKAWARRVANGLYALNSIGAFLLWSAV